LNRSAPGGAQTPDSEDRIFIFVLALHGWSLDQQPNEAQNDEEEPDNRSQHRPKLRGSRLKILSREPAGKANH
jgi:hypothetical protein